MNLTYDEFVAAKVTFDQSFGRQIGASEINPILKPHQRDLVRWAVAGGRRAIFAAFGIGKSVIQLETIRLSLPVGARGLIVCPLGVKSEVEHDAAMLGLAVTFVRRTEQVDLSTGGIYLEQAERDISAPSLFDLLDATAIAS